MGVKYQMAPIFATLKIKYSAGRLFWAQDLDGTRLMVNTILTVYVVIGTRLEERKLIREFGDEYIAYQKRVSMFFPWKWLMDKFHRLPNPLHWKPQNAKGSCPSGNP